jgi:hypothetical protein
MWRKTHTSSEAQKKWRKTHTSSEAQQSKEKLISEVRHKKMKKNSLLK